MILFIFNLSGVCAAGNGGELNVVLTYCVSRGFYLFLFKLMKSVGVLITLHLVQFSMFIDQ